MNNSEVRFYILIVGVLCHICPGNSKNTHVFLLQGPVCWLYCNTYIPTQSLYWEFWTELMGCFSLVLRIGDVHKFDSLCPGHSSDTIPTDLALKQTPVLCSTDACVSCYWTPQWAVSQQSLILSTANSEIKNTENNTLAQQGIQSTWGEAVCGVNLAQNSWGMVWSVTPRWAAMPPRLSTDIGWSRRLQIWG